MMKKRKISRNLKMAETLVTLHTYTHTPVFVNNKEKINIIKIEQINYV